jgi:hypothetical protein
MWLVKEPYNEDEATARNCGKGNNSIVSNTTDLAQLFNNILNTDS